MATAEIVAEPVIFEYPLVKTVKVMALVALIEGGALYLMNVIVTEVPIG